MNAMDALMNKDARPYFITDVTDYRTKCDGVMKLLVRENAETERMFVTGDKIVRVDLDKDGRATSFPLDKNRQSVTRSAKSSGFCGGRLLLWTMWRRPRRLTWSTTSWRCQTSRSIRFCGSSTRPSSPRTAR